jgi:hypothetical protein
VATFPAISHSAVDPQRRPEQRRHRRHVSEQPLPRISTHRCHLTCALQRRVRPLTTYSDTSRPISARPRSSDEQPHRARSGSFSDIGDHAGRRCPSFVR